MARRKARSTPVPSTPHNVRIAYAVALEAAGLANAIQIIDTLLDDGYQEQFAEYFPDSGDFATFRKRFRRSRLDTLDNFGWKYDADLLATDPKYTDSLRAYFDDVFRKSIRQEAS